MFSQYREHGVLLHRGFSFLDMAHQVPLYACSGLSSLMLPALKVLCLNVAAELSGATGAQ